MTEILLSGILSLNSINKRTWKTEYVVCAVLYENNYSYESSSVEISWHET